MKKKKYSNGKYKFTAYLKPAGEGWEVGFYSGEGQIFMGNFIHWKEASHWYTIMNTQIHDFSKKYTVGPMFPVSWYTHFAKNHLYKCYYAYLDKVFTGYNRSYETAFKKDVKKYNQMQKNWTHKKPFFKAA